MKQTVHRAEVGEDNRPALRRWGWKIVGFGAIAYIALAHEPTTTTVVHSWPTTSVSVPTPADLACETLGGVLCGDR